MDRSLPQAMPPLRRRDRLEGYADARRILITIIERDIAAAAGTAPAEGVADAGQRANEILLALDAAWRRVDRNARFGQRETNTRWRLILAEHERRSRLVFETFDRQKRRRGAGAAAVEAAKHWAEPATYKKGDRRKGHTAPRLWEQSIAEVLIDTLERAFTRR